MPSARTLGALAVGAAAAVGLVYAANAAHLSMISLEPGAMRAYRADDTELDHYRPGLVVIRDDELWWYPTRPLPASARMLHRYEVTLEEIEESTEPVEVPGREPPVFVRFWTTQGRIAFAAAPLPAKRIAAWAEEDSHDR